MAVQPPTRRRRKKKKVDCSKKRLRSLKRRRKPIPKACKRKVRRKPVVTAPAVPAPVPGALPGTAPGTHPAQTDPIDPAAGGGTPDPAPVQTPPKTTTIQTPIDVYDGSWGRAQAERLLWRAGFGPRPGDVDALIAKGMEQAVLSFTRPSGQAPMTGPEPTVDGFPLAPYDVWNHDHLYWMDRMLRSEHPLVERLALVFHDWLATSNQAVGSARLMLAQTNLFRTHGLGSFRAMITALTQDPAMILFLNADDNRKGSVNENYGRELMELFTLGANRGAYTEEDVRELARSLSGFRYDWSAELGAHNFRWDELDRWDPTNKTVFGQTGRWTWEDAVRFVIDHPKHPSYFVAKLWSYFVAEPPSADVASKLEALYVSSGQQIRPVLEAILVSPQFYAGPRMIKPPVVFVTGMMRALGIAITEGHWDWVCGNAGQRLYHPPDVAGWDETRWMDTSTTRGRWEAVTSCLEGKTFTPSNTYPAETAAEALASARAFWGDPWLSDETVAALTSFAQNSIPETANGYLRSQRQNALRQLIASSPDYQTS